MILPRLRELLINLTHIRKIVIEAAKSIPYTTLSPWFVGKGVASPTGEEVSIRVGRGVGKAVGVVAKRVGDGVGLPGVLVGNEVGGWW